MQTDVMTNMRTNVMAILDISKMYIVYEMRIHIKKMKAKFEGKLEADYCPNTLRRYPHKPLKKCSAKCAKMLGRANRNTLIIVSGITKVRFYVLLY